MYHTLYIVEKEGALTDRYAVALPGEIKVGTSQARLGCRKRGEKG